MATIWMILLGIGGAIILANVLVCYRVAMSDSFEPHQKYIQFVLIWLFPIVGAAVSYVFTREPKMTIQGYSQNASNSDIGDIGFSDGAGDYFSGEHHGD
jgi:hypothetical protein